MIEKKSNKKEKNKIYKNIPVVIMAGGKGTRLEPFTKVLPKPVIPVNEKPIIEHIISRFRRYHCDQFYITINYKGKILKAFFEELEPDYSLEFIEENTVFRDGYTYNKYSNKRISAIIPVHVWGNAVWLDDIVIFVE